jgi:subtilisin family serine protease
MGGDGTPAQPTIPAVMAGYSDEATLVGRVGADVTIEITPQYVYYPSRAGFMESFSSQGPSDVDFRVKPDVVAPGGNVLSSIPGNKWAFYSGTSMSSPHMAGMAAVVMGQHSGWTAAQVRSAIVNTANEAAVKGSFNPLTKPLIIGNGAADLAGAVSAKVALDPVSTSFGAVPAANGNTWSKTIAVSALTGSTANLSVALSGAAVNAFDATISGNVITVTFTPRDGTPGPQHAKLTVSDSSGAIATARLFAWSK